MPIRRPRRVSWQRRFEMEETWNAVQPNDGHRAVAQLVARGIVSHVITQNIDALHQEGGVPGEKMIELHGNTRYAKCLDCGARVEIPVIRAHYDLQGDAPDCEACGGIVKTATISFGQPMPEDEMARAHAASLACDLMLGAGLQPGGLSGGRLSAAGQKERRPAGHRQPRANPAGRPCRPYGSWGNRPRHDRGPSGFVSGLPVPISLLDCLIPESAP